MKNYTPDTSRLLLKETAFQNLMQRHIFSILLVASPYDIFMMEEDGRVEEQVYFEYKDLNLSSAPRFTKASNFTEARALCEASAPDLVIAMPGVEIGSTLEGARSLHALYPDVPFVLLCPFAREVSRRLQHEDLSGIDYVFSWLGNVDLILAIVKLIEDRMNAETDILDIGVQSIIVVEDSTRFISSMLPDLFKYLLKQSLNFSTEALNEHEKMLRMRGRPKVLLARDYNEALHLLDKYGSHTLGIITDARYPVDGTPVEDAGLRLTALVKERYPHMPVIVASTDRENAPRARELGAIFLDKSSKNFPIKLRDEVRRNFGFGDFVVRDPDTGTEIMRLRNLNELQKNIFNIPSGALMRLCADDSISRWLYSRALFPIADNLKRYRFDDISQTPAVRRLIFDTIVAYRRMKNRGVVAIFRKDRFDKYSNFARIGEGSMGGKGRGLAFIDSIIKRYPQCESLQGVNITIPRTIVLCTDIFDTFMDTNDLYDLALSDAGDETILQAFLKAELPASVMEDLRSIAEVIDKPMAVRSSSLLEDSHYQPFAGVYSTYMIPHADTPALQAKMLAKAVKGVYASVFYKESKAYMNATRNLIDREKMAVIIQEVAGEMHQGYYYPSFSGVGRSINYYPVGDEHADEGVVEVAAGLGKYIVDGGRALRFSPAHPAKAIQTSTLDQALNHTQTCLDALPADVSRSENLTDDDSFNMERLSIADAFKTGALKFLVSTYDAGDRILRDTGFGPGRKVVTFANVLQHNVFPLAEVSRFILSTGAYELGRPVEVEFAAMINPDAMGSDEKGTIYWLQMRPIVDRKEMLDDSWMMVPDSALIIRCDKALGHGLQDGVRTILYVKPSTFNSLDNVSLAAEIERLNNALIAENEPYVLIGPGRWGSSDSALGIPVKWTQIAGARVIVETTLPGYKIEPSQGTHFFQNLTSFGVAYFTVDPTGDSGYIDMDYLDRQPAVFESERLRMVRFPKALKIAVNGRKSNGVILKAE